MHKNIIKYKNAVLIGFPFLLLAVLGILALISFKVLDFVAGGEGILDTASSFFYLCSSVVCFYIFIQRLRAKDKNIQIYVYLILALGFFFIAMEEASWGQQYLHFKTPESFEDVNYQKETTLHNLNIFQKTAILNSSYIVLGGIFTLAPYIYSKFKNHKFIAFFKEFVPNKKLLVYSLPVTIFYSYIVIVEPIMQRIFDYEKSAVFLQETPETLMAIGFLLFSINLFKIWRNKIKTSI